MWCQNVQFWLINGLELPLGEKLTFGSLQTILLCIVGKLAGGGSVAVAVGVSDMCQVTGDTQHMQAGYTRDLRYSIYIYIHIYIGANICTCQEIQCLPYAGFLMTSCFFFIRRDLTSLL